MRRLKQGTPSTHPILADELRALRRRLQREQEPRSPFVFTSERGAPFSTAGFARIVERAGKTAKLAFKAHPHMLRHACGYALANKGHDTRALQAYLGHRNIQHTVRCTEPSEARFKVSFWKTRPDARQRLGGAFVVQDNIANTDGSFACLKLSRSGRHYMCSLRSSAQSWIGRAVCRVDFLPRTRGRPSTQARTPSRIKNGQFSSRQPRRFRSVLITFFLISYL